MHPFALVTITYPSYFLTEPDMASKKWLEIPEKENFGKIESNRIQFYAFLISLRVIKEKLHNKWLKKCSINFNFRLNWF